MARYVTYLHVVLLSGGVRSASVLHHSASAQHDHPQMRTTVLPSLLLAANYYATYASGRI